MKKIMLSIFFLTSFSSSMPQNTIISLDTLIPNNINADEELNALLNIITTTKKPLILKFYADWCMPCKRMSNMIKNVGEYFKDQITIIAINVDIYKKTSSNFAIQYIPTLIFFKDGKEVKRTNNISKNEMITIIQKFLL